MEQTVPLSFVTWLIGFLVALLGGCWGIFKYFESQLRNNIKESDEKLKRMYERMDENKKGYYADFVLIEVFKESNSARKEIVDTKFDALKDFFNEKFDNLEEAIKALSERYRNYIK